jgi:hypothetical protein
MREFDRFPARQRRSFELEPRIGLEQFAQHAIFLDWKSVSVR